MDGACSLADAIVAANDDMATGSCPKGDGDDRIVLDVDVDLTAADPSSSTIGGGQAGLPDITSILTIAKGAGETIDRSTGIFRIFYVGPTGDLILEGLTVSDGLIDPGAASPEEAHGGGIYVDGGRLALRLGTVLTAHQAVGSDGSSVGFAALGGAVYSTSTGIVSVHDSTLSDNFAQGGDGSFALTLKGGDARGRAIHSAGGTVEVMRSTLSGNSVLGGRGQGGAVFGEGATLVLEDSTLTGNAATGGRGSDGNGGASHGGAIFGSNGALTLQRSLLMGNTATGGEGDSGEGGIGHGGAIFSTSGAFVLDRSVLAENSAIGGNGLGTTDDHGGDARGGSVYHGGSGTAMITLCRISASTAAGGGGSSVGRGGSGEGGGLYNSGTDTEIQGTTLSNNTASGGFAGELGPGGAGRGGGLFDSGTTTTAVNSTLSGNAAIGGGVESSTRNAGDGLGGGVYTSTATLTHLTALSNTVTGGVNGSNASRNGTPLGEGVYSSGAVLTSSIVSSPGSSTADCFGLDPSSALNLGVSGDSSCSSTSLVIGTDIDGTLADNGSSRSQTHALLPGSVAIDATAAGCASVGNVDQRGLTRDGNCDIGAFEFGTMPDVSFSVSPTTLYESGGTNVALVTATASNLGFVDATVDFAFTGSATEGADFQTIGLDGAHQLTLNEGNNPASFGIFTIADVASEALETLVLTMGDVSALSISGSNPQSVEIVDRFPGTLTVAGLGDGAGTMTAAATIACASSQGVTSGDCTETPTYGTALAVVAAAGPGDTFTGWAGCDATSTMTVAGDVCHVTVTVDRTVTAGFVFTATASVTATDDSASEDPLDGGTFTVDLGRTNVSGSPITLDYLIAGTASNGSDYNLLSGTVLIPASSQFATVDVLPFDDTAIEGEETVMLTLKGADAPGVSVDGTSATVTLADDDSATLTVEGAGNASGTMVDSGTIDCHTAAGTTSGDCSETPAKGTDFAVVAGPEVENMIFAGWTGCDSTSTSALVDDTCHVNLTSDRTVTATFLDTTPPRVTRIASSPDGGSLAECESATRQIRGLSVAFDEPMFDPAGDTGTDDVTFPGNYQLISPGPDRAFQTEDCSGILGDDAAVPVNGVAYDDALFEASLSLAAPLADDLYRLLVCGSMALEDLSSNALDGDANGAGGDDFSLSFRVDADNLFDNGHLDCDLTGWFLDSTITQEIGHSEEDFESSTDSGSVQIMNLTAGEQWGVGQCFELDWPGIPYELSARHRLDLDPGSLFRVAQACLFFDSPGCLGTLVGESFQDFPTSNTSSSWSLLEGSFTAPSAASSAFCGFYAVPVRPEPFEIFFDSFFVGELPIFVDGLESGDTLEWSSSSP